MALRMRILALMERKCNLLFKQLLRVPRAPCKACWKTRCRT
ncbi:ATP synthase CF1 alpha subunit [Iris pallida]|uniref:ATP synthase CF1 alpha subunit (Chloroplast) n=1 Tax=Iris pallida TaxID=29817 RepID=A0AAX6G790_IRIPA|nr:ATP synthase CF1 alpha subunit [Iris pallida]